MKLQDKVILITACTRGIGLACVQACARAGGQVYMAARDQSRAEVIAGQLNREGCSVRWVHLDAAQPETFSSAVQKVVQQAGRLDVLVNNFGTSDPRQDRDFAATDPDVFLDTVTRNLQSVFLTSQSAARHMAAAGGGCIINISSVSSTVPDLSQVGYGTAKAAINHLTRLIAVQEAQHHIRCNAVLPGMTATEAVTKNLSDAFRRQFLRHIPLGRMGLPEEIAGAVVYLASDDAAYITGQLLSVSGGFGLATPLYADRTSRTDEDL